MKLGDRTGPALGDTDTWDRVKARTASKLAPLAPPWLVPAGLFVLAAVAHARWGSTSAAPVAASAMSGGGLLLTALTWKVARRGPAGRILAASSVALASVWMIAAMIAGPTASGVLDWGVGLAVVLALAWNIRAVFHAPGGGVHGDPLASLVEDNAERIGWTGTRVLDVVRDRIGVGRLTIALPARRTTKELRGAVDALEASAGLPRGALDVADDPDNAGQATVTVSDPRPMREPQPYPGPSRPGGSISEPLHVGNWQDGMPCLWDIISLGHHVTINGMTGSGKTLGGAYAFLGEAVTRHDVIIVAADVEKKKTTLGPLEPALHALATTPAQLRKLMKRLYALAGARREILDSRGLSQWEEGCGIPFIIVWFEEFAEIVKHLDLGQYTSFLRTCRDAGFMVVQSLQRSDWTQTPTMLRAQTSKWVFGTDTAEDAAFGLSDRQQAAGAKPEEWGIRYPGMSVLDVPTIPIERIAVPMRGWAWTKEQMSAHAAACPAAGKHVDPVTRSFLQDVAADEATPVRRDTATATPLDDDTDTDIADDTDEGDTGDGTEEQRRHDFAKIHMTTPDPSPATPPVSDTDMRHPGAPVSLEPDSRLSAEAAAAVLDRRVEELLAKQPTFKYSDLGADLLGEVGRSRGWVYQRLGRRVEGGLLVRDEDAGVWMCPGEEARLN
ncbi:hypothetical protein GCM10022221_68360 [Actinocorallia aurea]